MKFWHALVLILAPALILYGMSGRTPAQSGWVEPYVYDLAQEVHAAECTGRGCNLTPAIQRSMSACENELAGTAGNRAYTGCTFLIPAGDHSITETIAACRGHQFIGRGGTARRAATSIAVPDITAFHGQGFGFCGGSASGGFTIRDLALVYPSGPKTTPAIGIFAEAKIHVEGVWIAYPTIGIHISAGVDRTPKSNANSSRLVSVTTEYTRHAGIRFKGYDSNAHAVIAPNVNTSCMAEGAEMGDLEAEFGDCGGYVDHSFLGASAVAGHFGVAAGYPDVSIDGGSNRGTCFGCYQEGPDPGYLGAANSMWIGGKSVTPLGSGFHMSGSITTRLTIRNDQDPLNVVDMRLGRATNTGGAFYGLHHSANSWALRSKWAQTLNGGSFLEDVGNVSVGRVRSVRGTKNPDSSALGRTTHWDVEDAPP